MTQTLEAPKATLSVDPADKYWTMDEYEEIVKAGILDRQRVQLIMGRILQMSPQYVPHSIAIELVDRFLRVAFLGKRIRSQLPMKLQPDSQPEPDFAVVDGDVRAAKDHPTSALLIIEISDSSVRLDRTIKARLYGANAIQEYWILNLIEKKLEVHREPTAEGGYGSIKFFGPTDRVAPLAAPSHEILVADLLP